MKHIRTNVFCAKATEQENKVHTKCKINATLDAIPKHINIGQFSVGNHFDF